jgi:hypothetical protein
MTSGQLSAKLSGLAHTDRVQLHCPSLAGTTTVDLIAVHIEKGRVMLIGSTGDPRWDKRLVGGNGKT